MNKHNILVVAIVILASCMTVKSDSTYDTVVLEAGTHLLPAKNFDHVEVKNWEYTYIIEEPTPTRFFTTDQMQQSTDINYHQKYYYDIIDKGDESFLRLFIPQYFYKDEKRYKTHQIEFKIYYDKPLSTLSPQKIIPQTETYEYIIILNESYWNLVNNQFKHWKELHDAKINNILVVNVSDIINNPDYWVNATYGDATDASGGNHWIANGKQISSNYNLFNDSQAKIRNFLRYAYDTYSTEYVLLFGNRDLVPVRQACSYATGDEGGSYYNDLSHASDMYYACLHKTMNNNTNTRFMENRCYSYGWDDIDWGYDLCVGRVLINSMNEARRWINKTIDAYQGNSIDEYLKNHIVATKNNANQISSMTWSMIGDEFQENQTFLNNRNISSSQWNNIDDYVNGLIDGWSGFQFIYHTGHGGTLWTPYQPSNCFNDETPQFVYTEGCHSANFGSTSSSRMEQWLQDDGCAYAGIANSAYGWFIASTYYGESLCDYLFDNQTTNVWCQAHNDAREAHPTTNNSVFAMIIKESNFFGDPALEYQWYSESPIKMLTPNQTTYTTPHIVINWSSCTGVSRYSVIVAEDESFNSIIFNASNVSKYDWPSRVTEQYGVMSFVLPIDVEFKDYYVKIKAFRGG